MKKYKLILIIIIGLLLGSCNDDDKPKFPPQATLVSVTISTNTATGNYTYSDVDSDKEGTSTYQWYIADDAQGTNKTAISGATRKTYSYKGTEAGKFLSFAVTPIQTDKISGTQVTSSFAGPVQISDEKAESTDNITLYSVAGNTISIKKSYGIPNNLLRWTTAEKHQEVWNQVLKIIPEEYLSKISEFLIYAGGYNSKSDVYQTLGYVYPTDNALTKWRFALAIDYAYDVSFTNQNYGLNGTITHEFGHILTLDETQLDPNVASSSCQSYHPGEGCAFEASYINQLYQNYWADIPSDNSAQLNYSNYPERFITYYSATNPAEDIAETYRFYVLDKLPENSEFIYKQKILNLNAHIKLQNLRTFARGNLGSKGVYALRRNLHSQAHKKLGCATLKMLHKKTTK